MAGLRPIQRSAGTMRRMVAIGGLSLFLGAAPALAAKRPLVPDDVYALKDVTDPRVSPDGRFVAYEVTSLDAARDAVDTDIWISPLAGGEAFRLTTGPESETSPRFSPDGRFVAFLSERGGSSAQVWLIDPRGGEASRVTDIKGEISAFAWSPEGGRLALVVKDPAPDDAEKRPQPIVIRRLKFKKDGEGYLGNRRRHIQVFDRKTRTSLILTTGPYDDDEPVWSPDGRSIAFTSNRTPEPDGNENSDIFLIEARAGALPRRLSRSPGTDTAPAFSPDGRSIAFVAGPEPKDLWYGTLNLGVVAVTGGPETILTRELDRVVSLPRFSGDGRSIDFLVEEGGNSHLARMPAKGGPIQRVVDGELDVQAFDVGKSGETVVLVSHPDRPFEVSAVSSGGLKRVSRVNDRFLDGIALGAVTRFKAKSRDGTSIEAFLTRPQGAGQEGAAKGRLPAILWIHGGPNGQYSTAFDPLWQILAGCGYAVIGANPRGSTGYGQTFSHAIYKDWGNKDYDDIIAAVDRAVAMGVADPERLGVGGWSYGGMLTDVVITKTGRFKAAIAGASEANAFANYGVDEYQYAWETEAGLPWSSVETWMHLSPWFQIDKVSTPTLFMGGAEDHNVPILNSEQLYQSLRRLGIDTELVVYPGESHGIERPSFQKDRLERYISWFDSHLKGPAARPDARSSASAQR